MRDEDADDRLNDFAAAIYVVRCLAAAAIGAVCGVGLLLVMGLAIACAGKGVL
jgi:hypothetical protein